MCEVVKMRRRGFTNHEISARLKISIEEVRERLLQGGILPKVKREWTAEEEFELIMGRIRGESCEKIGKRLGRTQASVYTRYCKLREMDK